VEVAKFALHVAVGRVDWT